MVKIKVNCSTLTELRIRKGMLGTDLARDVGITRQGVYGIESGRANPSPALAKKIAEVLGVEFDDIFSLVEGE